MKKYIKLLSCVLSLATCFGCFPKTQAGEGSTTDGQTEIRTIEVSQNSIDYEDALDGFDAAKLTTDGTLTTFEAEKSISLEDFYELDNLAESDVAYYENATVSYNYSYDSETNVVTVSAKTIKAENIIEVEEIKGVAFINEKGNVDAVMNIDGDGLLLSEMQDAGAMRNCGWFADMFKKVVKVVAVASAVVAVAALVVATVGATAPAVIAVGAGVISGTVASTLASTCLTVAAVAAGISLASTLVASVDFDGVKYELKEYSAVASLLIRGFYYLAVGDKDGRMLLSPVRLPNLALAATAIKSGVSVYSPDEAEAKLVATTAGNGLKPKRDPAHENGYFAHYHMGERANKDHSHAFWGIPKPKGQY